MTTDTESVRTPRTEEQLREALAALARDVRVVVGEVVNPVDAYALDVVEGRIPGGRYHRLACARHLRDRRRENTPGFPYRFDYAKAERFFRFARQLRHYKGRQFAGRPIELSAAQIFRLGCIFGWIHVETGLRRFTTAYNELPRKNGKTLEAAIVALYVTFFDHEAGAEGYCIATKRQQARLVWEAAKKLVTTSGLSKRIEVRAHSLTREALTQKLEPLGSDADSTDGLNPYLITTDEFHAHRTRELVDVMESGTGARLTYLHFIITTAGDDLQTPCGAEHEYATQILDQVIDDDPSTLAYFAFIAHADVDDDPWSEDTWRKANPHYGISINPEDFAKAAAKAQKVPLSAAEFKQKRLNIWVGSSTPCLSIEGWRKGQSQWDPRELEGEPCYIGVDNASKIDLASLSALFPPRPGRPRWRVVQRIFTPADTLADRAHRDRAPYLIWREQGWLTVCQGSQIRQQDLLEGILEWSELYDIQRIGFDPWHVDNLDVQLQDEGCDEELLIHVPQTFAGMSSACLRVQAEILEGNIDARGCPVTMKAVSNVVAALDGKGNLMFNKKKSTGRIDPVISMTIAVALYIREHPDQESAYSDGQGLLVV